MDRGDVMSGLAEQFMSDWTSSVFRDRCMAQIENVRSETKPQENSSDPVETFLAQRSSKQLEEFIFEKSQTREDYVSLVAEMLMMLRQHAAKKLVNTELLEGASPQELSAAGFTPNGVGGKRDDGTRKNQTE